MSFIDPVGQMVVDPASAQGAVVIAGKRVYFCSNGCRDRYVADPSAYPLADPTRRQGERRQVSSGIGFAAAGGVSASMALLVLYFGLLTALSGWEFTQQEFARYWPYIVALAGGFGLQVGLFLFLRGLVHAGAGGKMVAVSGGTSGAAMVSCCSHYLVNLLPALGATGLVGLVGQYQVQLFWVGIAANLAGIAYVGHRLVSFLKEA